ncbi:MAG: hypothetical protein M1828_002906 [Chrysothrix sp. TS-e1954]|nr:MAG: hypothetical protein M1828_002906 [Chrysothrix sp. TS-e1954]
MPGSFHDSPGQGAADSKVPSSSKISAPLNSANDSVARPSGAMSPSQVPQPLKLDKKTLPPTPPLGITTGQDPPSLGPNRTMKPALPLGEIARGLRATESSASQSVGPSSGAEYYADRTPSPKDTRDVGPPGLASPPAAGPTTDTKALQSEIAHLENLVHEALQLANTAVDLHEARKVPAMLEEAEHRLQKASQRASHPLAPGDEPLGLAGGSVPYSDTSSSSSDDDVTYSRRSSKSSGAPLAAPSKVYEPIAVDWAYKNSQSIPVQPITSSGTGAIQAGPFRSTENTQAASSNRGLQPPAAPLPASSGRSGAPPIPQRQASLAAPLASGYAQPSPTAAPVQRSLARTPTNDNAPGAPAPPQNWGRDKFEESEYVSADELKGMAITTFFFWPLPLLHGRKPYLLTALAVALPLQFPQAIIVAVRRDPGVVGWRVGLLVSRAICGLALGFAHINFMTTLLDLFGASLQSTHPHGEIVVLDDIRRHGGGMGLWLGSWSFAWISSLSVGFFIGAEIVSGLNVTWGFYISFILIALTLFLDVITPETRRAPHRRTMLKVETPNAGVSRRVARGEIRMHVQGDGPKWWYEECFAGVYPAMKMLDQPGFGLIALYLGWIYGQVVLIIVLLGNLLSAGYGWRPEYVGLAALSLAAGALLAIPNTKANIFSRSRQKGPRTDSMTFQPRITWTSHMVRRAAFMIVLPLAGIGYAFASAGTKIHCSVPIVLTALIGYVSNLAIAECNGLIMETFDTSDLQPGANSKHRLQSLPLSTRRRRTAYSSYPRVSAGFFVSQSLGFLFAAAATGVGGAVTRNVGAQRATAITAGILLGLTILLTISLWRWKSVQVVPNTLFGAADDKRDSITSTQSDTTWRAVIIGNPSGKMRRMSLLELGGLSRWTEIRRLNRLLNRSTTQPLNAGWR